MPYIVDADWVIQALTGHQSTINALHSLAPEGIALSWITVGEIYEGAFSSPDPQAHLHSFRLFLRPFPVLGLNDPIMERFAEIRTYLRRRGEVIADFDIILGATALHYGLTVLTYNARHLGRVPNLKIYQPK